MVKYKKITFQVIKIREAHEIVILYHDKKTEKICKDIKKAKQELPAIVAEKLHALINLLESAENLCDISAGR